MGAERDEHQHHQHQHQHQPQEQQELELEIPQHFKCPISLCLMSDPVSISTGITYDRSSITKWLQEGRSFCPVTMQALESTALTPNRTLERIIRSWCSVNRRHSATPVSAKSRQEPPSPCPLDLPQARALLREISPQSLERLAGEVPRSKPVLLQAGVLDFLLAILSKSSSSDSEDDLFSPALNLLARLHALDLESSRRLNLPRLAWLLQRGDLLTRTSAAGVLEEICCCDRERRPAIGSTPGIFEGLVRLVREDSHHRGVLRAALRAILSLCPPIRNRVRLVESGAVAPIVELLVDSDKGTSEALLAVLECICGCAEGRAEVCRHALAIPVVTRKLFKASAMAGEYAIDVLWAMGKFCPDQGVARRMVDVGLFPKLFFFLQVGCNPRTKSKAGDLLKLLHSPYRECLASSESLLRISDAQA